MDEVVQQLQAAAIGGREESNFESYYKNRGREGGQNERRRDLLETQRQGRKRKIDRNRGILELVQAAEENIFRSPRRHWNPSIIVQGINHVSNYCNVLSGSEWLLEKPHDFAENWFMVACPKAVRMLVIAYKGTTKCFNKYGTFRFECRTALPGGNPCAVRSMQDTCVLDCFYYQNTQTMYVLDILAWNSYGLTDGEAGFRQYWMESYLDVIPEAKEISKNNELIFKILPKLSCTKESLNKFLSVYPYFEQNAPPLDGLLFYHSEARYFAGDTPLIGWLYPFMLPELLEEDLDIHDIYKLEQPEEYAGYIDFINKFESRAVRQRQRKMFAQRSDGIGEAQDNAVEPMPVDTNQTSTAQAQGYTASSAHQNGGTNGSNNFATMESENSDELDITVDKMESMVAGIVDE